MAGIYTGVIHHGTTAERPAFGHRGTLFINSEACQIELDTGIAWETIATSGGGAVWGDITGTLINQDDLNTALNAKAASSHAHAAADVTGTAVLTADARLSDARTPTAHAASHQSGGADEISVAGLSGLLFDAQTAAAHATSHKSGGGDAIKLDELAAPTDVTTLDATTVQHGLLPKLGGGTVNFLRADGAWAGPTATTPEVLQSNQSPVADVSVAAGYSVFADEEMVIADGMEFALLDGASLVIL